MAFDYKTPAGLGKQTLGGHKQNLVHTRTQERGSVTPQETEPGLPVSVQESLVELWINSAVRDTEYNTPGIKPLEGGCHYLCQSFASGQTTGTEYSHTH